MGLSYYYTNWVVKKNASDRCPMMSQSSQHPVPQRSLTTTPAGQPPSTRLLPAVLPQWAHPTDAGFRWGRLDTTSSRCSPAGYSLWSHQTSDWPGSGSRATDQKICIRYHTSFFCWQDGSNILFLRWFTCACIICACMYVYILCVCICKHLHLWSFMHIWLYMYLYKDPEREREIYIYTYAYIYIYVCVCVVWMDGWTDGWMHVCTFFWPIIAPHSNLGKNDENTYPWAMGATPLFTNSCGKHVCIYVIICIYTIIIAVSQHHVANHHKSPKLGVIRFFFTIINFNWLHI